MNEEITEDDGDLFSAYVFDGLTNVVEMNSVDTDNSDLEQIDSSRNPYTISGKPYPVRPDTVKFVNVGKSFVNHTYRDFTSMPNDGNYVFPNTIESMNFHEKLYHLLTFNKATSSGVTIGWCCSGRAFRIRQAEALTGLGILRFYFGYNCMQRFQKDLNSNGYKQISRASGGTCFYSEVRTLRLQVF